jgi:hypothetical protein
MFRELYAHHQEVDCIDAASGIVILSKWPSDAQVERKLSMTIPDAASIQLNLLMMSI